MATIDTVRRGIVPNASAEEIRSLMWCCSPYPFSGDWRKIRRSIRKCIRRGGGTISGAIDYAHAELDRAWTEHRASLAETEATP